MFYSLKANFIDPLLLFDLIMSWYFCQYSFFYLFICFILNKCIMWVFLLIGSVFEVILCVYVCLMTLLKTPSTTTLYAHTASTPANTANYFMTLGGACFVGFENRPAVDLIFSVPIKILRLHCPQLDHELLWEIWEKYTQSLFKQYSESK